MYVIRASAEICWVGDGVGPMSVPSAQKLKVSLTPPQLVGGGDSPTTSTISTAMTTVGASLATLLNANIGQIQGFSTGGG